MPPNRLLAAGRVLPLADTPGQAKVVGFIGAGGQGEVYRATVFGHEAALKWYLPHYLPQDPGLWERLERLVFLAPPSRLFVWPYARVGSPHTAGFGYLMPLKRPQGVSLRELLYGPVDRSFRLLSRVAVHTCEQMRHLHLAGLCYRDLNLGNFSYDPATGEVEVLDNDNVDVESEAASVGTAEFAAPEVLLGIAAPSRYTDLWSLAVLLFQIAVLQDPFIGELLTTRFGGVLDRQAMHDLHAHPIFIFDPHNSSNAPPGDEVEGRRLWGGYPESLRTLFIRSFTVGVANPRARVTEAEWSEAFVRIHDSLFPCPSCGADNVLDLDRKDATPCFGCEKPVIPQLLLTIGGRRLVLRSGASLYRHHLKRRRECNLTDPIAHVDEASFCNSSGEDWTVERPGGTPFTVVNGEAAAITLGMRINFGGESGVVTQAKTSHVAPG